jgi:predicted transcriptional regulator YheO
MDRAKRQSPCKERRGGQDLLISIKERLLSGFMMKKEHTVDLICKIMGVSKHTLYKYIEA